jgi:hypothetical protein
MRSSASARHMRAMPSWLESEYSWIRPATLVPPSSFFWRSDDQLARQGLRRLRLGLRQAGRLEQRWQALGFGPAASGRDARAQFILRPDVADEFLEGYRGTPGLIDRQAL